MMLSTDWPECKLASAVGLTQTYSESLDIVHGQLVATQMEQSILKHTAMSVPATHVSSQTFPSRQQRLLRKKQSGQLQDLR